MQRRASSRVSKPAAVRRPGRRKSAPSIDTSPSTSRLSRTSSGPIHLHPKGILPQPGVDRGCGPLAVHSAERGRGWPLQPARASIQWKWAQKIRRIAFSEPNSWMARGAAAGKKSRNHCSGVRLTKSVVARGDYNDRGNCRLGTNSVRLVDHRYHRHHDSLPTNGAPAR